MSARPRPKTKDNEAIVDAIIFFPRRWSWRSSKETRPTSSFVFTGHRRPSSWNKSAKKHRGRNELEGEVGEDNSLSLSLSFTWNNGWCLAFNPRTLVTRRRSSNDNQSRTGSPFAIFLPFVPPLRLIISSSHGIFETFNLCSWQSVLSACLLIDRPSLSILLSANLDPWSIFIAFFILKNKLKVREVIDKNSFEFFELI